MKNTPPPKKYQKGTAGAKSAREAKLGIGVTGSPKAIFQRKQDKYPKEREEDNLKNLKGKDLELALRARFPKKTWKPSVMLVPNPVVMLSCGGGKEKIRPNIVTVAWAGIVNTEPPMLSVSIRPERLSHEIIMKTREFVVNIPSVSLAKVVDWCGMKSGRDVDKFAEMRLTSLPAEQVSCPIIADCPINIECKVAKVIPLGTHDMFIAKIVAVQIAENLLDKKGKLCLEDADLLCYAHSEYHLLGKKIGAFGFSVRKR